jgi:hypothetical protein
MSLSTGTRQSPDGAPQGNGSQRVGLKDVAFMGDQGDGHAMYVAETAEVNRLKWIESEKAGRDIGWARAVWLWTTTHRQAWLAAWRETHPV